MTSVEKSTSLRIPARATKASAEARVRQLASGSVHLLTCWFGACAFGLVLEALEQTPSNQEVMVSLQASLPGVGHLAGRTALHLLRT